MVSNVIFPPYLMTPLDHTLGSNQLCVYTTFSLTFDTKDPDKALAALQTGVSRLVNQLPFLAGEQVPSSGSDEKENQMVVQPLSPDSLEKNPIFHVRHHSRYLPRDGFVQGCSVGFESRVTAILQGDYYPFVFFYGGTFKPLLRLQANVLLDGIILCISFNHNAFDGTGMDNIMTALATCCKASDDEPILLATSPEAEATARQAIFDAVHKPQPKDDPSPTYGAWDWSGWSADESNSTKQDIVAENLYLSPAKLQALKDTCNQEIPEIQKPQHDPTVTFLSTDDILNALIWLCMAQACSDNQPLTSVPSSMGRAVNVRHRFQPPVPKSYIGTAMILSQVQYPQAELTQSPPFVDPIASTLPRSYTSLLSRLALKLRKSLNEVDDQYISSVVSKVCEAKDWSQISTSWVDMSIGSLTHFTIYQQDFGASLGMVQSFDLPLIGHSGMAHIKPRRHLHHQKGSGPDEDLGPFEVYLPLEASAMQRLKENNLFRWAAMGSPGIDRDGF